ncbi:hypothetical protein [Streptomyces ureilyticus]|uniref:Uncharacterized protein n=1 Tax=Streptomyces ureilyticus TaxID=1775131 RepID=A0ABX0E341_9ACTN|nr:hypothetical protein [Streptomyces ureilyticus]NGO47300.1 hypothetical protein [Streptomyces ureilyticus]
MTGQRVQSHVNVDDLPGNNQVREVIVCGGGSREPQILACRPDNSFDTEMPADIVAAVSRVLETSRPL